jgi:hypothetical protein
VDVVLDRLYLLESFECGVDGGECPSTRINPALSACEARLATSSRLLAVFLADCATVALPQIRETEQLCRPSKLQRRRQEAPFGRLHRAGSIIGWESLNNFGHARNRGNCPQSGRITASATLDA